MIQRQQEVLDRQNLYHQQANPEQPVTSLEGIPEMDGDHDKDWATVPNSPSDGDDKMLPGPASPTELNTPSDSDDNMLLGPARITKKAPQPDTPAKHMFKSAKSAVLKEADDEEK